MSLNHQAEIIGKTMLTSDVMLVRLKIIDKEEFTYKPGQYISIDVGMNIKRSYSISSYITPKSTEFDLIIDTRPKGPGSLFWINSKINDNLNFLGPIGFFTFDNPKSHKIFFIGTGTGIAPLKAMIESIVKSDNKPGYQIYIYFGTRVKVSIILSEYFLNLLDQGKIKDYKIFLSDEDVYDISYIKKGFVTKFIEEFDKTELYESNFYICGLGAMVKSTEQMLLENGVPQDNIHHEKFQL